MVNKINGIEKTLMEVRVWTRALALVALFYLMVFGPDQVKEIVRLWK